MSIAIVASLMALDASAEWPMLPTEDGQAEIPAQEWAYEPGPRTVTAYVRYPGGSQAGVDAGTGLMLSLHNWGGTGFRGAPDPDALSERYNLVVIGVDYLQSGPYEAEKGPPYDHGYLQAIDALRALYWVYSSLQEGGIEFDRSRIYATGGSGGGNVSLMVNKFAPRTFAGIVDLSGMARLNDDIAFGLPGGTHLNAGYSRDPAHPHYLSPDEQTIRDPGFPAHLATMQSLGNEARVVVIHGTADASCPVSDAQNLVENMKAAGLDVEPYFVTPDDADGSPFKNAEHSLGDRTEILCAIAGAYLDAHEPKALHRNGPTDFDRADEAVRYETGGGAYVVSYRNGYPQIQFEATDNQ